MPQSKSEPRHAQPHKAFKQFSIFFITLAVLLVLGITYLALAKVTITLIPDKEPVDYNFKLLVSQQTAGQAEQPANDGLPENNQPLINGVILSKSLDVKQQFTIKHGQTIDSQATGKVIIYNQRPVSQTLVATTRLLTPQGVLFRLKNKVIIPPHSQTEAEVYADKKGAQGNIGPTSFTIPGLSANLQKLVYAESKQPMSGGLKTIGILDQNDIDQAAAELKKTAAADLLAEYLKNYPDLSLLGTQIELTNLKTEPDLGSQTDSFTLQGKLNIKAVYADPKIILALARKNIQEKNQTNKTINIDPSSLNYEIININPATQKAVIKVNLKGLPNLKSANDLFNKDILIGFTEKDLKLYFSQFDFIKDVRVEFSPFWVKKVPILKDHIIIKIAE